MKLIPLDADAARFEGPSLRDHYEANALAALRTIWRRKWLIFLLVVLAIMLAAFALSMIGKRYTAEAFIQFDFARSGTPGPPTATIDGAVLIESEARILRSRRLARAVAERLNLAQDAAYMPRPSALSAALGFVRGALAGGSATPSASIDNVASVLLDHVVVTNDPRSYLVGVAFTADNPEVAARIANAWTVEYFESKLIQRLLEREVAAKVELDRLAASYGSKHPTVVLATAELADARAELATEKKNANASVDPNRFLSEGLTPAQPIAIPSGPRAAVVLLVTAVGALAAGIAISLLLERRDRGFRTDLEVAPATGIRCVGIIPRDASTMAMDAVRSPKAMSAISIAAGLDHAETPRRTVVITSSIPGEGKSFVASALADLLVTGGHRALIIDATPRNPSGDATTLEDVLVSEEAFEGFRKERRSERISTLGRVVGSGTDQTVFASPPFERLLKQARECYDFIIIEAPPVLLFPDAMLLGRFGDIVLHTAKWHSTPRKTVIAALRRLADADVRVRGVILSDVDLDKHKKYAAVDQAYYLREYDKFYERSI